MKAKYYIVSHKKVRQSFLSRVNSVSDSGQMQEPYDIVLDKYSLFGLLKKRVTKRIHLPVGFNAEKNLTKGREFKF